MILILICKYICVFWHNCIICCERFSFIQLFYSNSQWLFLEQLWFVCRASHASVRLRQWPDHWQCVKGEAGCDELCMWLLLDMRTQTLPLSLTCLTIETQACRRRWRIATDICIMSWQKPSWPFPRTSVCPVARCWFVFYLSLFFFWHWFKFEVHCEVERGVAGSES